MKASLCTFCAHAPCQCHAKQPVCTKCGLKSWHCTCQAYGFAAAAAPDNMISMPAPQVVKLPPVGMSRCRFHKCGGMYVPETSTAHYREMYCSKVCETAVAMNIAKELTLDDIRGVIVLVERAMAEAGGAR